MTTNFLLTLCSSDFMVPHWGCDTCAGNPEQFYSAANSTTSKLISCKEKQYHCAKCTPKDQCVYTVNFVGKSGDMESLVLTFIQVFRRRSCFLVMSSLLPAPK